MIPIPEELAKRVLEALCFAAQDADIEWWAARDAPVAERVPWYSERAERKAKAANAIRDELAALLTPKEAT